MPDPLRVTFRKLAMNDLTLMHRWHNEPHVNQWWEKVPMSYEDVVAKHGPSIRGEKPIHSYIVEVDSNPIGYIQWYLINDFPYISVANDVAGIDLFIGEADYLYKGFGSLILRRFLKEVVFATPGVNECVIDPAATNKAAIKAFERAGFEYWQTFAESDHEEPKYLMRIGRERVNRDV